MSAHINEFVDEDIDSTMLISILSIELDKGNYDMSQYTDCLDEISIAVVDYMNEYKFTKEFIDYFIKKCNITDNETRNKLRSNIIKYYNK